MSVRHVARTVAASLAAVCAAGAFSVIALSSPAGAGSLPSNGTVCGTPIVSGCVDDTATVPASGYTAGTPFSSGQQITVTVPANTIFSSTTNLNIVECAAPGGVIPTATSACDGNTINGNSLKPAANGSVSYLHYPIYALPDYTNLLETSGPPFCNLGNECVLYIGTNQNDFTQPHVWSSPFYVNPGDGTDSGANPGDGTPEVPLAVMLPLAAIGLAGGALFLRRRKLARA